MPGGRWRGSGLSGLRRSMPGGYDGDLYDSEQWPDHLPSLYRVRPLRPLLPGNAPALDSIAAAPLKGDECAVPCTRSTNNASQAFLVVYVADNNFDVVAPRPRPHRVNESIGRREKCRCRSRVYRYGRWRGTMTTMRWRLTRWSSATVAGRSRTCSSMCVVTTVSNASSAKGRFSELEALNSTAGCFSRVAIFNNDADYMHFARLWREPCEQSSAASNFEGRLSHYFVDQSIDATTITVGSKTLSLGGPTISIPKLALG